MGQRPVENHRSGGKFISAKEITAKGPV